MLAFLLSIAAKNCQVDAIASSLLASFVLCIILGASLFGLSDTILTCVLDISIYIVSEEVPNISSSGACSFFSLSTAVGISAKDPSGVMFRDGSNLISSPLGMFGVKHPSILVYWQGTSSSGSLQIHSLYIYDQRSSFSLK